MSRRNRILIYGGVVLFVILFMAAMSWPSIRDSRNRDDVPELNPNVTAENFTAGRESVIVPAEAGSTPVATPQDGQAPAVSEQAVRDSQPVHDPTYWDGSLPRPEIQTLQLMTAKDLHDFLELDVPVADEAQVYVVELSGRFRVVAPPLYIGGNLFTGDLSRVVIDATTGQLLMTTVEHLVREN